MAHRTSSTAFHDFLFNMLLIFVVLFVMAFFLIRPPAEPPADVDTTDMVLFELTWPDDSNTDLDMWIQLPTGEIISFKSKETAIAALERDDRGKTGDIAIINGEARPLLQNLEVARIRNLIDGEYLISVFNYRADSAGLEPFAFSIVDAQNHRTVLMETGNVSYRGEVPIVRFKVINGEISHVDTTSKHFLVNQKERTSTGQYDRQGTNASEAAPTSAGHTTVPSQPNCAGNDNCYNVPNQARERNPGVNVSPDALYRPGEGMRQPF